MITNLYLENFRAIRKCIVPLGKITILTGANNSGKSSIIYGLLALKNLILNSNQSLDSLLNLGFINLGGFDETVHLKKNTSNILVSVDVERDGVNAQYSASLGKNKSKLSLETATPFRCSLDLEVTFPYPANKNTGSEVHWSGYHAKITWNGVSPPTINVIPKPPEPPEKPQSDKLSKESTTLSESPRKGENVNLEEAEVTISNTLNAPMDELRGVDFIPLRRGFTKPNYSSVGMQQQLLTEDELATLLASNRDLEGKVAHYLEQIINRVFSVRSPIGTANFNLQSRDRNTGLVCDLVNEGFGTNQLVTILTKSLREEMHTICIEESEIHLHPQLMDNLVEVLIKIVKAEDKNFIISTHSEHIVLSLLNKIGQKKLKPENVALYYFTKEHEGVSIERQRVNEKGQVEGGLKGFYEAELEQVKQFFSIPKGS